MTNSIMTFTKKKFGKVRGYVNDDGIVYLNVESVARNLGFVDKNGQIRLTEVNRLWEKFGYPFFVGVGEYIPEITHAIKATKNCTLNFQSLPIRRRVFQTVTDLFQTTKSKLSAKSLKILWEKFFCAV